MNLCFCCFESITHQNWCVDSDGIFFASQTSLTERGCRKIYFSITLFPDRLSKESAFVLLPNGFLLAYYVPQASPPVITPFQHFQLKSNCTFSIFKWTSPLIPSSIIVVSWKLKSSSMCYCINDRYSVIMWDSTTVPKMNNITGLLIEHDSITLWNWSKIDWWKF